MEMDVYGKGISDNSELLRMVLELRSRMDGYEECMESKDKELAHVKMKWKDEVDELKRNEVGTRKMLEDLRAENVEMKSEMIFLKKEEENLRRESSKVEAELNKLSKEHEELCRENAEIRVELNILKKEQENLRTVNQLFEGEETKQLKDAMINSTSSRGTANIQYSTLGLNALGSKLLQRPVGRKKFEVYYKSADNVQIIDDHLLEFMKPAVLSLPLAFLGCADKVYFEVTCRNGDIGVKRWCALGWASREFKSSAAPLIYRLPGIRWYFPTSTCRYDNGDESSPHDNSCKTFGDVSSDLGREYVIGVAANMPEGQLLYSFKGKWDAPMGIAFRFLSPATQYFPVFAGFNMTLDVNLGDTDFKYLPPDQSYKKVQ